MERIGALSTHSAKHPGFPFGSQMPYALADDGTPIFLFSGMAMHTQNVLEDARASLLVMQSDGDARATLLGTVMKVENPPRAYRDTYLERHPASRQWMNFGDFSFYRLDISAIYFVGGFGQAGWVTPADYRAS